jgi:hypothetical protein
MKKPLSLLFAVLIPLNGCAGGLLAPSGSNWVELPNPDTSETDSSEVAETLVLQGVDLVRIYTTNFETVVITDPEIYRDSIISTTGRPPTGIALKDVVRWERGEVLSSQISDVANPIGDVVKKHWWPIIMVGGGVALLVAFWNQMNAPLGGPATSMPVMALSQAKRVRCMTPKVSSDGSRPHEVLND